MSNAISQSALDQVFLQAHTAQKFQDRPVTDEQIRELYDLLKWAPTSMNSQPARFVFLKSVEAKQKLVPALMGGNVEKTLKSPVTVIVANDTKFYDYMPELFKAYDTKPMFEGNAQLAHDTAFRNASLQGAYLIVAARMLGLDAGPMSGFNPAAVNEVFFPDGRLQTNFLINLGYAEKDTHFPRGPRFEFEKVAKIL